MITYLDRVCFGAAAPDIASELGLANVAGLKWAFTAFAIAYALFEIPAGWWGDVLGPRGTLLRIVAGWSLFTVLTGLVGVRIGVWTLGGVGTLAAVRFLFGLAEAGAYPNIARALHNWFPAGARATAQGYVWMSGRLIGGLTPVVWSVLTAGTAWTPALISWRGTFALFGLFGLLWCVLFALRFRNTPAEHPDVNAAERELIGPPDPTASEHTRIPWQAFASSLDLWALCVMYFCFAYGWYFNITYLPSFLKDRFAVPDDRLWSALYKGAPLWVGAAGCLGGGMLADWLIRRLGNRRLARRLLGFGGLAAGAGCWLLASGSSNVHLFVLWTAGAALCGDLTLASAWATCQDVGRRFAAVTAACMNTVGTVGAAAAGWLTGTLVQHGLVARSLSAGVPWEELAASDKLAALLSGYHASFYTYAAAYFVAALCWLIIDPTRTITR